MPIFASRLLASHNVNVVNLNTGEEVLHESLISGDTCYKFRVMLLQFSGETVTVFLDTNDDHFFKIRRNGESLYLNRKQKCLNLS